MKHHCKEIALQCLCKWLERGTFELPWGEEGQTHVMIDATQLTMLIVPPQLPELDPQDPGTARAVDVPRAALVCAVSCTSAA